jgi:hypothetical protein
MTSRSPADQFIDEHPRLRFAQAELQIGKAFAQERERLGQYIGRDRRNDSEGQRPAQRFRAVAGIVHEIARRIENLHGAAMHFLAQRRELDIVAAPLDQRRAELRLEFLDLHGERRLADIHLLGGAAEMARSGKGIEIHGRKNRRQERGQMPVHRARADHGTATGGRSSWTSVLHRNSTLSDPMGEDFDYAKEFKTSTSTR